MEGSPKYFRPTLNRTSLRGVQSSALLFPLRKPGNATFHPSLSTTMHTHCTIANMRTVTTLTSLVAATSLAFDTTLDEGNVWEGNVQFTGNSSWKMTSQKIPTNTDVEMAYLRDESKPLTTTSLSRVSATRTRVGCRRVHEAGSRG